MKPLAAFAILVLILAGEAHARTWRVRPGPTAQQDLQSALISAGPGDVVRLDSGRFELSAALMLDIDDVVIRGEGQDNTILSFAAQRRGEEALLVTSDRVELRDFAIEDASKNGVTVRDCAGVSIRDMRVEWTRGPHPQNGAFGLHVVNCSNVVIDSVIARGASDAGVNVSQSRTVIVRKSIAEYNVAGVEIENTYNADVSENFLSHNTGGILIFDLPNLAQKGGHGVRVFENEISENNTPMFAAPQSIAATLPAGTGLLVMANSDVHVFNNEFDKHASTHILISAYRLAIDDPAYNPLPRNIMVRDNDFGAAGFAPAGELEALAAAGVVMPDILWDGADTYFAGGAPRSEPVRIVVNKNHSTRSERASFLSLGLNVAGAPLSEALPDPTYPPVIELPEPERVRIR